MLLRRIRNSLALFAVLACWVAQQATAASILLDPPDGWNGLLISGTVVAGWKEHGGPAVDSSTATGVLFCPPYPAVSPGEVLAGAPLALSVLPTSGLPKDKAEVSVAYRWQVGTPSPDSFDRFFFDIDATTSAEAAFHSFGGGIPVKADAFVTVDLQLYIPAPIPAGTLATIALPALPVLTAGPPHIESLAAVAEMGPFFPPPPRSVWTMSPGSGDLILPLVLEDVSDVFIYTLRYELLTPFGSDPTVSIALEGGAARVVPEPSGMILIGCAAAAWCLRQFATRGTGSQRRVLDVAVAEVSLKPIAFASGA